MSMGLEIIFSSHLDLGENLCLRPFVFEFLKN